MSGTEVLRNDHKQIRRLEKVVFRCYTCLYAGQDVPFSDMEKITTIISEFLDAIHYSREEDSYFACVASYNSLNEEIRRFMIEHEFGRRVASKIAKHLHDWKSGNEHSREAVARFMKTYHVYLTDHLSKEDKFFDEVENTILTPEEEAEMHEQFRSVMTVTRTVNEMIKEIEYLEKQYWYKGKLG